MSKQPHRFLEIALLIGLIVGAGTTYALTPLIDNMLSTSSSSNTQGPSTTTIFSTITSTQQSTVTVPQTIVSTTTSTPDASTTTRILTSTSTSTSTRVRTLTTTTTTTRTSTETSTTTETTTVTSSSTKTSSSATTDISHATIPLGSSTNSSLGFQPRTLLLVIGVNNTVQWLNLDSVTHSIIFLTFDIQGQPALDPGQTFSVTFTNVGKVSYFDMYYPWMRGTVTVLKE